MRRITIGCALALGLAALGVSAQAVSDDPGITVDLNGSEVLHRTPVRYPGNARVQGIEGTVVVEVTLDASGMVSDARVLSGPAELRRPSLASVLDWHFTRDAANTTRPVTIRFQLPPEADRRPAGPDFRPSLVVSGPPPLGPIGRRVHGIEVLGLPADAAADLRSRLPVHEGDVLSEELAANTSRIVREFDEHLSMGTKMEASGEITVEIHTPGEVPAPPRPPDGPPPGPARIRVSGDIQQFKLITRVPPSYPPLARENRIQGIVRLLVVVGKDGTVQDVKVISGHPLLTAAAVDAVKQWVYRPTVVNGAPTEVQTDANVEFTLPAP